MDIDAVAAQLPNGFHDSLLRSVSADLVHGTVEFVLDVWIGTMRSAFEDERERYRAARLTLEGVSYLSIDPPGAGEEWWRSTPAMIDLCEADEALVARLEIPGGGFAARFFVSDWNAFIHFGALDAKLFWTGPE